MSRALAWGRSWISTRMGHYWYRVPMALSTGWLLAKCFSSEPVIVLGVVPWPRAGRRYVADPDELLRVKGERERSAHHGSPYGKEAPSGLHRPVCEKV